MCGFLIGTATLRRSLYPRLRRTRRRGAYTYRHRSRNLTRKNHIWKAHSKSGPFKAAISFVGYLPSQMRVVLCGWRISDTHFSLRLRSRAQVFPVLSSAGRSRLTRKPFRCRIGDSTAVVVELEVAAVLLVRVVCPGAS